MVGHHSLEAFRQCVRREWIGRCLEPVGVVPLAEPGVQPNGVSGEVGHLLRRLHRPQERRRNDAVDRQRGDAAPECPGLLHAVRRQTGVVRAVGRAVPVGVHEVLPIAVPGDPERAHASCKTNENRAAPEETGGWNAYTALPRAC